MNHRLTQMNTSNFKNSLACAALCGFLAALSAAADGVSPYAGLWVGTVGLKTVSEVSIPLDADNVPRAPDPARPTVTGDRADLTLILHVNGAGQVSLLKDVAVINRNLSGNASATAADIAAAGSDEASLSLVTDPALYAEYPMTKATRIASVAFDFGDARATAVLDDLVAGAVTAAVAKVQGYSAAAIDTSGERNAIVNGQAPVIADGLAARVGAADAAGAYAAFLDAYVAQAAAIAAAPSGSAAQNAAAAANALKGASVFGDTRAQAFVAAVKAAGPDAANAAASFADVENRFSRLLSGKTVGDAVVAAAAFVSTNATATLELLKNSGLPDVNAAVAAALLAKVGTGDTRATDAVDAVLAAAVGAANANAGQLPASGIREEALAAGRAEVLRWLANYPDARGGPTGDYTAFVTSAAFTGAPLAAARAALAAVLLERVDNPLTWAERAASVGQAAAENALEAVYVVAARATRHELPMEGTFGLGNGDPRFAIDVPAAEALGPAGLSGTVVLPASHPTNPFRHRRHPDHTRGFDITRRIRMDFDAAQQDGGMASVARGVSSVEGLYREEVFGLHKPLGPGRDTGLKTEGRFQLNRISTIGILNGK
jgi:hypothetical protein